MLSFLLTLCLGAYLGALGLALWAWRKSPAVPPLSAVAFAEGPFLSVIVAVRDEAENIGALLEDLERQSYCRFEVLVVDDGSEDETREIVASFAEQASFPLRLLRRREGDRLGHTPKKAAILQGISTSRGEIIAATDGDCRVPERWLENIARCFAEGEWQMICGPVALEGERNFFERLQAVELMALVGVGAAGLYLRRPNMCNGANLAYRKEAFREVGGFAGNANLASGDDEFLLHKMAERWPEQVLFLKNQSAIVRTAPQRSGRALLEQRKRWAGKWRHYRRPQAKVLALGIYAFHALFAAALPLAFLGKISPAVLAGAVLAKVLGEGLYAKALAPFFGKKKICLPALALSLAYSYYVLGVGLLSFRKKYRWKGGFGGNSAFFSMRGNFVKLLPWISVLKRSFGNFWKTGIAGIECPSREKGKKPSQGSLRSPAAPLGRGTSVGTGCRAP